MGFFFLSWYSFGNIIRFFHFLLCLKSVFIYSVDSLFLHIFFYKRALTYVITKNIYTRRCHVETVYYQWAKHHGLLDINWYILGFYTFNQTVGKRVIRPKHNSNTLVHSICTLSLKLFQMGKYSPVLTTWKKFRKLGHRLWSFCHQIFSSRLD